MEVGRCSCLKSSRTCPVLVSWLYMFLFSSLEDWAVWDMTLKQSLFTRPWSLPKKAMNRAQLPAASAACHIPQFLATGSPKASATVSIDSGKKKVLKHRRSGQSPSSRGLNWEVSLLNAHPACCFFWSGTGFTVDESVWLVWGRFATCGFHSMVP